MDTNTVVLIAVALSAAIGIVALLMRGAFAAAFERGKTKFRIRADTSARGDRKPEGGRGVEILRGGQIRDSKGVDIQVGDRVSYGDAPRQEPAPERQRDDAP